MNVVQDSLLLVNISQNSLKQTVKVKAFKFLRNHGVRSRPDEDLRFRTRPLGSVILYRKRTAIVAPDGPMVALIQSTEPSQAYAPLGRSSPSRVMPASSLGAPSISNTGFTVCSVGFNLIVIADCSAIRANARRSGLYEGMPSRAPATSMFGGVEKAAAPLS